MSPTHRPFYDFWRQVETDAEVKVKQHSSILWPFINKEGRHPPPLFLDTDSQYFHRAVLTDMVVERAHPTGDMKLILRGVSGDAYGTLKKIPEADPGVWLHLSIKDDDWPTSTMYGKEWPLWQYSTSSGMVILEAHDMYPVQSEPELPSNTQTEGLQTSVLEIPFEATYQLPLQRITYGQCARIPITLPNKSATCTIMCNS
ncbi:hypothetical protein DER46DRAFT_626162 [Fusarium sp. MPI-SDFR-AT-0072]|nr:hypothetical protein DER46DRAFT_626162 [Fusarium sp. MPI-SDFR-AT-0072]